MMIKRNPGVTAVWVCSSYQIEQHRGHLFRIGTPLRVMWYAHGREATRAEVEESIGFGLPALMRMAEQEGRDATEALEQAAQAARAYLPAAAAH